MNECKSCAHHSVISALERCDMPLLPKMEDQHGPCCAFIRADYGVHGWAHCGPEGKFWEGRG